MAVTVTINGKDRNKFPCLMIADDLGTPDPVIILADDARTQNDELFGTVLQGGGRYNVGDYRETWKYSKFDTYLGSLTIENHR